MRELDRKATEIYGVPSLQLMENAGRGTAEVILKHLPNVRQIGIFCGKGNNGGDGFVIARYLFNAAFRVEIVLPANPDELQGDAKINYEKIVKLGIPVHQQSDPKSYDLIVDALLGIGLQSEVRENYRKVIEAINDSGKKIVAVDIPSGLNADTGEVMGAAIKANITATMGMIKHGLLRGKGRECSGVIEVIDIGLPQELVNKGFPA